ncbi:hypothetical protein FA95DRAFT_1558902 [Auriscalpium vulgare]|uniref:Uncharacterized protein n=1 Tax=Auriscalpium vulgare TaxID=40419 RepID=A0ACB8RU48_9AGAM|nr:hypothetical protein FA95DRAFT_1558902 [Auriscalpium vulgare]
MLKSFIYDPASSRGPELVRWERLARSNPALVVKRAQEGSSVAFQTLAMHCADLPAIQQRTVIKMSCAGLDASTIPRSLLTHQEPTPSALSALSCAVSGLLTIEALTFGKASDSLIMPRIASRWHGIYQWTAFIDEIYPILADEDKPHVYDILGQAISVMERHELTGKVVRDTPGVFGLIASIWAKYKPQPKGGAIYSPPGFLPRLLMNLLRTPNEEDLARFVAATGKTPAVARLALLRLRAVTRDPTSPLNKFSTHTDMLMWLSHGGQRATLRKAVVREDGVAVLTKSILALVDRRGRDAETQATVSLNFCVLTRYFKTRGSVHSVRSAIRNGLLLAYVKLIPAFADYHKFHQQKIIAVLMDIVTPHLSYGSVVEQAVESVGEILAGLPWEDMAESQLKNALLYLSQIIKERGEFMKEWGTIKHTAHCDSCGARLSKEVLKACANCHAVLYCSKSCQAAAWAAHKKTCALRRRIGSQAHDGPSKADWMCLRQLALKSARQAMMAQDAPKDRPGVPLSDLGISLDFWTANVSVISIEEVAALPCLRDDGSDTVALARNVLERARTMRGSSTLLRTDTMLGNDTGIGLLLVCPSIWDGNRMEDSDLRVVDAAWVDIVWLEDSV